eukprot:TRINITY_DN35918_c0_g1_i2.p2 TRINITY_DN35918_c0_g1~~TRINITY_DN35918_c0_g1_i2.p2  ORF type:complete len:139 (+),score=35.83 TRINITY_DN35918_c0_g1_i2:75-491(+)
MFVFFFFSSRRRHTRCREVSWARRCVQETGTWASTFIVLKFKFRQVRDVFKSLFLLIFTQRFNHKHLLQGAQKWLKSISRKSNVYPTNRLKFIRDIPVSYTHLTLPTILLVQISVVAVSLKKKKIENITTTQIQRSLT